DHHCQKQHDDCPRRSRDGPGTAQHDKCAEVVECVFAHAAFLFDVLGAASRMVRRPYSRIQAASASLSSSTPARAFAAALASSVDSPPVPKISLRQVPGMTDTTAAPCL